MLKSVTYMSVSKIIRMYNERKKVFTVATKTNLKICYIINITRTLQNLYEKNLKCQLGCLLDSRFINPMPAWHLDLDD